MTKLTATTWECPYCDHRVRYGTGCANGDLMACTLGTKNIHYDARLYWQKTNGKVTPVTSIGIAEIANDDNLEDHDDTTE